MTASSAIFFQGHINIIQISLNSLLAAIAIPREWNPATTFCPCPFSSQLHHHLLIWHQLSEARTKSKPFDTGTWHFPSILILWQGFNWEAQGGQTGIIFILVLSSLHWHTLGSQQDPQEDTALRACQESRHLSYMEGCVQPEVETGEPQTQGRWKGSQAVTKHSISMKVGQHQMKLAQGRFRTKSSSSHQCLQSCKISCQRTQAGILHSSQKKPLGKKPIKYRSSPLLQNLSPRHWKLGIYSNCNFVLTFIFIFPGASAVGHSPKQEAGQRRSACGCSWDCN